MAKRNQHLSRRQKRQRLTARSLWLIFFLEAVFIAILVFYFYNFFIKPKYSNNSTKKKEAAKVEIKTGKILSEEPAKIYSAADVKNIINQTSKKFDSPVSVDVTRQVFSFTTSDGKGDKVPVFARAYVPSGGGKKPIIAFAPGVTGMDDACAASLENVGKADWGNYDSQLMAYASQGNAVVVIDYEGMRDAARLHHFMVGELEGKALLDAIRSLGNLAVSKDQVDSSKVFVAGYSEGGHAAYWADQIKDSYAPEVSLKGSIGFGPVTSVEETLDDAANGANTNWFGDFVLASYSDWYKATYPVDKILQPNFAKNYVNFSKSVCKDAFDKVWPSNIGTNRSDQVYLPEFIKVAKDLNIGADPVYANFSDAMAKNIVGNVKTDRPKLINHGVHDDVIFISQSQHGFERMCVKGNIVAFKRYDTNPFAVQGSNPAGLVDHYQIMNASFKDTIAWMQGILSDQQTVNNCK